MSTLSLVSATMSVLSRAVHATGRVGDLERLSGVVVAVE